MPISADPNDTVSFFLTIDREKQDANPFKLRFLTVRQRMNADRLIREASEEKTDEEANAKLTKIIGIGVANLDEFPDLDDYLSIYEKWELAYAVQTRTSMEEYDRKKSISDRMSAAPATSESETISNPS